MSTGARWPGSAVNLACKSTFAPVADVNINRRIPVINTRSFWRKSVNVADTVIAYARGLEDGGVLSGKQTLSRSWRYGRGFASFIAEAVVFACTSGQCGAFYPFRKAIQAGLSGMMVGHLKCRCLSRNEEYLLAFAQSSA